MMTKWYHKRATAKQPESRHDILQSMAQCCFKVHYYQCKTYDPDQNYWLAGSSLMLIAQPM